MLVLSRYIGETVVINDNTRITFLGIHGQQIRLGFEAPPEVIINREEIQQRIDAGVPKITIRPSARF